MGLFSTKYRTTRRRAKQQLAKVGAQQEAGFGQQRLAISDALEAIRSSESKQLGALGGVYGQGRQDIRESGQQAYASGAQNLAQRGLGNTTITGGLQRGVNSDVQRQLGRSYASEAGQRAGVFGRTGGQEANLYGLLAQIYGQQTGAQTQLGLAGMGPATMTGGGLSSVIGGAMSGAAAGGSTGNPWMAAAGGILGGIGGASR